MHTSSSFLADEGYIQAAPNSQLSSSHSALLYTLLNEEDQCDYNQLLTTLLPHHILTILHQVTYLSLVEHLSLSSIYSYVHSFSFHHPSRGWQLSYSKNFSFDNIHAISSPLLHLSHSQLNMIILHRKSSITRYLLSIVTSITSNTSM